jgi:hypothetical protein
MLLFVFNPVVAIDSKELRKQQQVAQKERQARKNERTKGINESRKVLKEYSHELKMEYQEQTKELDTEFDFRRVELRAIHEAKIAEAEAENQKKMSALFMTPGLQFDENTVEQLQAEGKIFADEVFAIRKQSAEVLHQEKIANEERKNTLLTERDSKVMDKASTLGLMQDYVPILATPIGNGLTEREEKWNAKEKKEVDKLKERSLKNLRDFRNGEKLRAWEIGVLNEDFKLAWDEKTELHALDSQQTFFNTLYMQSLQGKPVNSQDLMSEIAEINKKKKLINIEYKKIRDQNRIKRRKEKKDILAN